MDTWHFDVFLSHNSKDKPAVEHLGRKLQHAGLEPWLDKWCLTPGGRWQDELVQGLRASSACAVFVGPHGLGDWVHEELGVALDRAAKDRSFRLFLVLLPGLPEPFDASTLPPFLSTRTWVDLRAGIDDPRTVQHLINAIKGVPFGQDHLPEPNDDICPYRGLQTFDEEHADIFFGRENDVQRLVEKLKGTAFLAVLGASGSGKSSLVRAGLLPALRKGALPDSHTWQSCVFTPGAHPLTTLAAQLVRLSSHESMQATLDQLSADPRTLHLATALALADQPTTTHVVWVIDQFEEVFTLCSDEQERAHFLANLLSAAAVPDGRCLIILTLRADFYPKCAAYPDLSARIAAQQVLVSPMGLENLRQAIEEPAWRTGLEFEEGLVATILDDVAHQPGALPLLEHALLELWERRRGRLLTLEGYRASGGVQGAIAKRAETIYSHLAPQEQEIARRTLLRLTQPGEGTEDTRRRATLDELLMRSRTGAVEEVVQALVTARLLTTSEDEPAHQQVVEVAHEALIRGWPRLRQWIEEDRAGLREHRRLTEAALEWQHLDRDEGVLYRGARLAAALEWREHNDETLNDLERAFLEASAVLQQNEADEERERRQRELEAARQLAAAEGQRAEAAHALARSERKRARIARLFTAGLSVVLVLALVAAGLAVQQNGVAQARQQEASSRALAANALAQLQIDPELSLLLAAQAMRTAHTAEAVDALRVALGASHLRAVLRGHSGPVTSAAYSPDGRYVLTSSAVATAASATGAAPAGGDESARIWEAGTHRVVTVLHMRGLTGAVFSSNGRYVATASADGTARLWSAPMGRLLAVLRGHTGAVDSVAFSPDSAEVVTASADKTARVWATPSGRLMAVLRGHRAGVHSAAFSPNGAEVVTAGDDGFAGVWQAHTGRLTAILVALQGKQIVNRGGVVSAVFSPDGRWVATVNRDGTAQVWQVNTQCVARATPRVWCAALTIPNDLGAITNVAFSPDSHALVTAPQGGIAQFFQQRAGGAGWNGTSRQVFTGSLSPITSVAFSPDSRYVATASADGTAWLWEVASDAQIAVLHGHATGLPLNSITFSPNGQSVLTASADGTARVWNAGAGRIVATVPDLPGCAGCNYIFGAVFSPDGTHIATASADGLARLWEARTGRLITTLRGHTKAVISVAFSPDGRWVVTASADHTARVWNARTGRLIAVLRGHTKSVGSVAVSPDGKWIATASGDKTARLWQVGAWRTVHVLRGHTKALDSVTFSPDSRWIATASLDGTARVWDVHTGRVIAVLRGHTGQVASVVFSHDGTWVAASGTNDGATRVWETRTWSNVAVLHGPTFEYGAAFSPDSSVLAVSTGDYTTQLWEAGTWRAVETLYGPTNGVYDTTFSPDNRWIVAASVDQTARLYPCDVCGSPSDLLRRAAAYVTRPLTPRERTAYLRT